MPPEARWATFMDGALLHLTPALFPHAWGEGGGRRDQSDPVAGSA